MPRYGGGCLSLVIWKMQIRSTQMRFYSSPLRMTILKRAEDKHSWQGCVKTYIHCKLVQPMWKSSRSPPNANRPQMQTATGIRQSSDGSNSAHPLTESSPGTCSLKETALRLCRQRAYSTTGHGACASSPAHRQHRERNPKILASLLCTGRLSLTNKAT